MTTLAWLLDMLLAARNAVKFAAPLTFPEFETERRGSRVGVRLFGDRRVFHRPHPGPDADKGALRASANG